MANQKKTDLEHLKRLAGLREEMNWNLKVPDIARAGERSLQRLSPIIQDGKLKPEDVEQFDRTLADLKSIITQLEKFRQNIRLPGDPQF